MSPKPPPPVLDNARVLEYARLYASVAFSGHTNIFVGGKEVGRSPCLAIVQYLHEDEVSLLLCRSNWRSMAAAAFPDLKSAKERAERIYPGLSIRWKKRGVTKAQAKRYLDRYWGKRRCAFCRKRPDEVAQILGLGKALACDSCIEELHRLLQDR